MTDSPDSLLIPVLSGILRELERITHPEAELLALQAKTIAMRRQGGACCGSCLFFLRATWGWMENHGRTRPRVESWTGWCTGDTRRNPRMTKGDPTERQSTDLPCGKYTAVPDEMPYPPRAHQRRNRS